LRRCSYNILNHSKWRKFEKDLLKCLVVGTQLVIGRFTLLSIKEGWLFVFLKSQTIVHFTILLVLSKSFWCTLLLLLMLLCVCMCGGEFFPFLSCLLPHVLAFIFFLLHTQQHCHRHGERIGLLFRNWQEGQRFVVKGLHLWPQVSNCHNHQFGLVSQTDKHPKNYFHLQ
jgi:hypothetical protein